MKQQTATRKKATRKTTARKSPPPARTRAHPAATIPSRAPSPTVKPKSATSSATPASAAGAPPAAPASGTRKSARKGITIVSPKPPRPPPKPARGEETIGADKPLFSPGQPPRTPLIPSGPAAPRRSLPTNGGEWLKTSPYDAATIERFRQILLQKRQELVGAVSHLEQEALRSGSGSLSHLPQHLAEQGSDTYEQSLSLDIAEADRKLIREIDDALRRIDEGRFGICEKTGKPIPLERLEELPWARYSIEAARERERYSNLPR